MMLGCMHALLLARASTQPTNNKGSTIHLQWAELKGATNHHELLELIGRKQPANAELLRKAGAALRAASPAAPPVAVEPAASPAASLPLEIYDSAWRGELQRVTEWLGKGGPVDALAPVRTADGRSTTATLLHAAASNGHLELVKELLKRYSAGADACRCWRHHRPQRRSRVQHRWHNHVHCLHGSPEVAPCGAVRTSEHMWRLRGADAAVPLLPRASAGVGTAAHGLIVSVYFPIFSYPQLLSIYRAEPPRPRPQGEPRRVPLRES